MRSLPLLLVPLLLLGCTEDNPAYPTPEQPIDGIYQYVSGDTNLEGASLWFQGHDPFQFRLINPDWVDTQGDTFSIEEEGHYWTRGSTIYLDVNHHSPPGFIEFYTFAPGENEFSYTLETDYLTLSGEDWRDGKDWATEWTASEFSPYVGQFWFQSSQETTLDSFWNGAALVLESDFSFSLRNPVEQGATPVTVEESGTYERTEDVITFTVTSREGGDGLYTLPDSTTEISYSEYSLSLLLDLEHEGLADPATIWTEGEKEWWKAETYSNDDPSQAQSVSGTWYYEVYGNVSSGGVSGDTYIGDLDYYRVITSGDGTLSVTVSWSTNADMDVYLYQDDAETLLNNDGATYTDNPETFNESVSGGSRYCILIAAYEGSGDYLLTVNVP